MNLVLTANKIFSLGAPCLFHSLTGLYCPGCGGTRAVRSLLKGDLRMSFQYHPLVLYTVIVVILEILLKGGGSRKKRCRIYLLIGAAVWAVNWIFKDYMLVCRGVDLLPVLK